MDFSSTELFVEILVAGTLFAVGLAPIIALLVADGPNPFAKPPARRHGAHAAAPEAGDEWKHLRQLMAAAVAVAFVYSLGVAGNRVVEVLYDETPIGYDKPPPEKAAPAKSPTSPKSADSKPDPYATHDRYTEFEREIRHHGETYRDWVERHKTYRKILRAASASSLLFLVSTLIYYLYHVIAQREPRLFANAGRYCLVAIVLFAFFTIAFRTEDKHYKLDLAKYHADFLKDRPPPMGE
jgi:hypothetical protein